MVQLILKPSIRSRVFQLFIETAGLQSARGRLLFFCCITFALLLVPYHWLGNLSLWQMIGIPSPSIGLTRAYWLLIHGDPLGAFERNPLIYAVIAIGLPLLIADGIKFIQQIRAGNSQMYQP